MVPRVFLSSTFEDLHDERQTILRIAESCGWEPVQFPKIQDIDLPSVLTHIHREIRSCDVFVNLLQLRYGSPIDDRDPRLPISFTHFEFALARKLGKPIVSLVLSESEFHPEERGWRSGYAPGDRDLSDLRREVQTAEDEGQCLCREFSKRSKARNDLENIARTALTEAKHRFERGEFQTGSLTNRVQIQQPESIPQGQLSGRRPIALAARLEYAQYFWDYNLPLIAFRNALELFIGAGTTSELLVMALLDALRWTQMYGYAQLNLATNNALLPVTLADRLEELNCRLSVVPGQLDSKYMAIFPDKSAQSAFQTELSRAMVPEHALHVGGVSIPRKGHPRGRNAIDTLQLMSKSSAGREYAHLLFVNAVDRHDIDEDRLIEFVRTVQEAGGESSPLGFCIGSGSTERRGSFANAFSRCDLEAISPTYDRHEYNSSMPVLALNDQFRGVFGPLIG